MKRWLRAVIPFAVVVALITVTLVAHSIQQPDPERPSFLSPVSDAGDGGLRLAQRLAGLGVPVDRRTSSSEAIAAAVAGSATLFVPVPEFVDPDALSQLRLIPPMVRLVLVAPTNDALIAAGAGARMRGPRWTAAVAEPGCAEPFATAPAAVHRWQYEPLADDLFRCYADSVVELDMPGPPITLVGATDPFRNDRLDEHGNEAFAVGLLSRSERVVWLDLHEPEGRAAGEDEDADETVPEPDPAETDSDPQDEPGAGEPRPEPTGGDTPPPVAQEQPPNPLGRVFPPAFWATVTLLVLAAVALAAAAARRLGTPVAEPLPATVRAAETVRGLGGLYRRARARDASLATVQEAAVRRLAAHVGLPAGSGVDEVAGPVAAVVGRTEHEVRALLGGGVEDTDEDLAAKATAVQNLVRYVTGRQADDEGKLW